MRSSSLKLAALLGLLYAAPAWSVEVSPIYGLQIMGGQYFFGGERGSLSGNASAVVAPAVKLDDRWAILPSVNSSYQGTKQVVDLVGAGTLFQEQMDHRVSVRAVYTPEESLWRLKPSAYFKYQLLKETKDESWTSGLFDYRKMGLGFEAEYEYHEPFALRMTADYYKVSYPNYNSLESQAAAGLSRELAGGRVLDNDNAAFSISLDGPVGRRLIAEGTIYANYARFGEQHVVDPAGSLTAPTRGDITTSVSAGVKMPTELNSDLRLLPALNVGYTYNTSNQNSYDAQRTQWIPFYYNYGEWRLSPSLKALFGPVKSPIVASLGYTYWKRVYPHRLNQDANGSYQTDNIRTNNWMISTSLNYPMAPHFSLLFNLQHGKSSSNQGYQQFYTYNYTATNYLFGFSYDY